MACLTINRNNTVFMLKRSSLALLPLVTAVASAQEASLSSKEQVLEEVLVTASRRAEGTAIMDTAISLEAMTGAQIESRGFTSVMDVVQQTPGVSVSKSSISGDAIQVRGVSAIIGDSVVGYYLDDLPYTRINANVLPDAQPYDLKRVEVLRGPQGTLFGAGSAGGTVRILTQDPDLETFGGKFTAAGSTTDGGGDNWRAQAALNIPLVKDTLALRLVGSKNDQDGWIDLPLVGEEDFNSREDDSYRAKLLWQVNDRLSIMASHWDWKMDAFNPWGNEEGEAFPVFTEFQWQFTPDPANPLAPLPNGNVIPATSSRLFVNTDNELTGLTIKYDTGNYSFTSVTSELSGSYEEGYSLAGTYIEGGFDVLDSFAQEFRVASSYEGKWNWTGGAIYLDMENKRANSGGTFIFISEELPIPGLPLPTGEFQVAPPAPDESRSESVAVYGESIYEFNERWELTVGLRYFEDDREELDRNPLYADVIPILGIDNPQKASFDKLTGRVNLAFRPNDDTLYYATVAEGFRSGAVNSAAALVDGVAAGVEFPNKVDPDLLISYELGTKWSVMDGRVNVEGAVYYIDWEDIITLVVFPGSSGQLVGAGLNASAAKGMGVDLGLSYANQGLVLTLGGSYNGLEYEGDLLGAGIRDGDPVSQVPEITWSATATYNWAMGSLNGVAYLGANYTDERTDYSFLGSFTSDDMTLVNGRVGLEGEQWGVYLTANNLLDEDGAFSQQAFLATVGADPIRVQPLTYGVEVNFNF